MTQQYHLPLPHRSAMTAEDFYITPANREAAGWLLNRGPATWPSHALILYGPPGCGKTHLLTAWRLRQRGRKIALKENVVEEIVSGKCRVPLALDDARPVPGDAAAEEWLQHLFNATRSANLPLLLTALTPPGAWGLQLKDVASRLCSCQTAALHEPDDALFRALLVKQFGDRQLLVEDGVIEYLLRHLERTGAVARAAVALLDNKALETGRKISVALAQAVVVDSSAL